MVETVPDLAGRVAIVTGGNSGIGLAIATLMAARGARLLVAGRREQHNADAVAAIRAAGGIAEPFSCDVTQEAEIVALVEKAVQQFGRLDICVANAGGSGGGNAPLVEMETSMWRNAIALNLDGVFLLYREAARRMIAAGTSGSLIGMSSVAAIRASGAVHYAAAKGALNAMTVCLAPQLGPHGIRVNTIMPGMIETPVTQPHLFSEKARSSAIRRIPLGRIGLPNDVAELACFLAGETAAFITGQHFIVDGGMTTN